ncbi:MAG: serine hydrolase domain-containing protein [Syntrophales bacterium]
MKIIKRIMAATILFMLLVTMASAQGLPKAKTPEEVGLSTERLKRISAGFQADVDKGMIPGAVIMIVRRGKVAYFEAIGYQDREKKIPMKRDSIFRIASMSKPFTSLAIMMLAEEGKIQLFKPASTYLPEFKDLKVGVEKTDPATGQKELTLVPPEREMTVQDLMRHTSGITYGIFGKSMVKELYNKTKEGNPWDFNQTNAEMVTKFSKLPLANQPGTTWEYSQSTDVLGRIVEVVSGLELDALIAERIAKPLKLSDTGFWAEGEKRAMRVAEPQVDPVTGKRPTMIPDATKRPRWISAGGGMLSTASDYARFCQMFLDKGALDGVRMVAPKTVELMSSNHLPPGTKFASGSWAQFIAMLPSPEMGQGFGLGFCVRTEPGLNPCPGSVGEYYWAGALGTYFWIDPREQLIAVLMMNAPAPRLHYRVVIRDYVYQAIVK